MSQVLGIFVQLPSNWKSHIVSQYACHLAGLDNGPTVLNVNFVVVDKNMSERTNESKSGHAQKIVIF